MKRIFTLLVGTFALGLVGCGDGGQPKNVMEGADQSAIQSYEQMVAEDEATMTAADPQDVVPEEGAEGTEGTEAADPAPAEE